VLLLLSCPCCATMLYEEATGKPKAVVGLTPLGWRDCVCGRCRIVVARQVDGRHRLQQLKEDQQPHLLGAATGCALGGAAATPATDACEAARTASSARGTPRSARGATCAGLHSASGSAPYSPLIAAATVGGPSRSMSKVSRGTDGRHDGDAPSHRTGGQWRTAPG